MCQASITSQHTVDYSTVLLTDHFVYAALYLYFYHEFNDDMTSPTPTVCALPNWHQCATLIQKHYKNTHTTFGSVK